MILCSFCAGTETKMGELSAQPQNFGHEFLFGTPTCTQNGIASIECGCFILVMFLSHLKQGFLPEKVLSIQIVIA